jgi:hypothetical protein
MGRKYFVTYSPDHPGTGVEFYIVPGEFGVITPFHRDDSLMVACFNGHEPGLEKLREVGIKLFARGDRTYFEIDARDHQIAAEAIGAYERTAIQRSRKYNY